MNVSGVTLWRGASLVTLDPGRAGLGIIPRGALAQQAGRIVYAGPDDDLPASLVVTDEIDLGGRLVTPGLIDCHTHLVHAGNRAHEFERRLAGATYAEIAAEGGGILSTVRATRAADEDDLVATALVRLDRLLAEGVTTIEIKSGYGPETGAELRMLRAAIRLGAERAVTVSPTLLAAHAIPPGIARADYLDEIVARMIPEVAALALAQSVDVFCETIAFTLAECERVLSAAKAAGLGLRVHAEQLARTGGADLAARLGALSAEHLEHATDADAAALARSGTVAVLLPGAFYFLRETKMPPIQAFRDHGVAMAVATDCNPGSSPLTSLLLAMNMASTLFRLTVDEAFRGVTCHAAKALGMLPEIGSLEVGKRCDLAIWNAERVAELVCAMGANPLHRRVHGGVPC